LVKENVIRVYKFEKRADGLPTNVKAVLDFPKVEKRIGEGLLDFGIFSSREMKAMLLRLESLVQADSSCQQK
jgi:hypothetical protein